MRGEAKITVAIKRRCLCGHIWMEELSIKQVKYCVKADPVSGTQLELIGHIESAAVGGVIGRFGFHCPRCEERLLPYGMQVVESDM